MPQRQGTAMTTRNDRSIAELFSEALAQLAKLIGNEFDLAKAEFSAKAAQIGRGVVMIGVGALLAIPALVILLFSVAAALMHAGFSDPVSYLVTGGAAAIVAMALIGVGIGRLSGDALKPSMTIEQLQQDKAAAKEMVR